MPDIIVLTLLGIAIFAALWYRKKGSKNGGGCAGCSGGASCENCGKKN